MNTVVPNQVAHAPAPAEKPGKFSSVDFKRWQQKMFFYLTTLSLQKFIKEEVPNPNEQVPEKDRFLVIEALKHFDFLCMNYILSGLDDILYNVYSNINTSKELWEALEKKYKAEDAGLKKFVAAKFLDYKMVDTKAVVTQIQELQVIIHDLLNEGMIINEAFQVAAFIEKLSPAWKDFKNYLKHKHKEMTLEDLIVRLKIEEDNRHAEKRSLRQSSISGENIIEYAPNAKKRKKNYGPKNHNNSNKKFKGSCYNCGKSGHRSSECRAPKNKNKNNDSSAYLLESDNLWHARLGHVNYKSLQKMINMEILPKFECNKFKCQVCVESKFAKHPYNSVERNSEPLDLIHKDICDMKSISSHGGKKYFITFIDDCTRYCYVYLLIAKMRQLMHSNNIKLKLKINLIKRLK